MPLVLWFSFVTIQGWWRGKPAAQIVVMIISWLMLFSLIDSGTLAMIGAVCAATFPGLLRKLRHRFDRRPWYAEFYESYTDDLR